MTIRTTDGDDGDDAETVPCQACNGRGKDAAGNRCAACDGSGKVPLDDDDEDDDDDSKTTNKTSPPEADALANYDRLAAALHEAGAAITTALAEEAEISRDLGAVKLPVAMSPSRAPSSP